MQDDPARYWQDLTENYRQMSDGELLELAAKPEELTDIAQQVLRDEMKVRALAPAAQKSQGAMPMRLDRPAALHWEPTRFRNAPPDEKNESEQPHEYTWKTMLCECDTREEALDVAMALKEAGIESWISTPNLSWGLGGPRLQVAADQLEQAQAFLSSYVPRQQQPEEVPDFELPRCPKCGGTEDVVLESAEPTNSWLCEACGAEWVDTDPSAAEDADEETSPT